MSAWDDKPHDYEHALAIIERLQADKMAISQTASDYLHEIERLRAELAAERAARVAVASPVRQEGEP